MSVLSRFLPQLPELITEPRPPVVPGGPGNPLNPPPPGWPDGVPWPPAPVPRPPGPPPPPVRPVLTGPERQARCLMSSIYAIGDPTSLAMVQQSCAEANPPNYVRQANDSNGKWIMVFEYIYIDESQL